MKTMNVIFVVLMLAGSILFVGKCRHRQIDSASGTDCSRQVFQSHAGSPSGHQRLERKRGQREQPTRAYGFYYGAATVDGLLNLSTLFCGKNPERFFNTRLIAGVGYNQTFDEGASSFMGRLGLQASFRLSKAFDFNVEALANGVSDRWNRKDDHNFDSSASRWSTRTRILNTAMPTSSRSTTKSTSLRDKLQNTSVPNRNLVQK